MTCAVYSQDEMDKALARARTAENELRSVRDQFRGLIESTAGAKGQIEQANERAEKALADLRSAKAQWDHQEKVLTAQLREARDKAAKAEIKATEAEQRAARIQRDFGPKPKGLAGVAEVVADALDDLAMVRENVGGQGHG